MILRKRHKTGEKPNDEILKKFNSSYDWLKKYIYKYELVKITHFTHDAEENSKPIIAMKRNRDTSNFALWLGKSTGSLVKLWHPAGMAENQNISLTLEDACQNILVLGGIGSGKTTCVMQPILLQCLDQQCGGLIFDIKGDVKEAVKKFAAATQKELVILGPNHTRMNLIEGLTPEVAASFLKSAFLLSDKGSLDPFQNPAGWTLAGNTVTNSLRRPVAWGTKGDGGRGSADAVVVVRARVGRGAKELFSTDRLACGRGARRQRRRLLIFAFIDRPS